MPQIATQHTHPCTCNPERHPLAQANHFIVTKYKDGTHNIGFHFDKPNDIAPGSLITIVKTGTCARPFELRRRVADQTQQMATRPFFSEVLQPGTAVIMTLEANLQTQHGVPQVEESGPSGSIVFRTFTRTIPWEQLERKVRKRKRAGKRKQAAAAGHLAPGLEPALG